MVEVDELLSKNKNSCNSMDNETRVANTNVIKRVIKDPNFVKSNSLGILAAGESHHYHGPTILHWEGGYAGERKIQEVKPLLFIKREYANWQVITLRRLYQHETIKKILAKIPNNTKNMGQTKDTGGYLKVYSNKIKLMESVNNFEPLSGMLDNNNQLWVACRPSGTSSSRSGITIIEVMFNDKSGAEVQKMCWVAPLLVTETCMHYSSISELMSVVKQYVLFLPLMDTDGQIFINKYYAVGHEWTERTSNNTFKSSIMSIELYNEWLDHADHNSQTTASMPL